MKMPKKVLDHYSYGKALADLDNTRKELERWKKMAQRNNPSGCCCQFDENNGDPELVKPCAFHAEWRDKALEALTGKMRRLSDKWNDESNEMAIQLSAEIKKKIELRSKCNTLRRCCDELCAAVKSRGNYDYISGLQ